MTTLAKQRGQDAEGLALKYLVKQGLKLLAQNFQCRLGEIDLIMRDNDCIAFIEVRYRQQSRYGSSIESITRKKQQKIIATALYYLQQQRVLGKQPCRFDVVAISLQEQKSVIEWIKNAFQ